MSERMYKFVKIRLSNGDWQTIRVFEVERNAQYFAKEMQMKGFEVRIE